MSAYLIQSRHGQQGDFELVVPLSHGEGLVHYTRDNDQAAMPWSGPNCFGNGLLDGVSLIQSNFGAAGNLEVVAVDSNGGLQFYRRQDETPFTWSGPSQITDGVRGAPSLIQSRHGVKGNFEVVVPHRDGGLVHWARENDDPNLPWNGPFRFGDNRQYDGAALIQSNFGSIGNLEIVAVTEADLVFYARQDEEPGTWSGPFPIGSAVRGAPSLIQGRHGVKGNFEVVVPHRDGGLVHWARENDDPNLPWLGPFRFGDGRLYDRVALIQSNIGSNGNLEVVAIDNSGRLAFFWRMDAEPWTWFGPVPVSVERSWTVSECVYNWPAAYAQADTDVVVRIQLNPDAGISGATIANLQTTWRNGIINKWSNRFDCLAPNGERAAINFDVQWVTENAHHVVRVKHGPGRSVMRIWHTPDSGDVVSHEFGHMLGNPDEYFDAACPSRSPINTGTVMADNTEVVARHLNNIAGFHCGHTPGSSTDFHAHPGENVKMLMFEGLAEPNRAEFLETIKRAATSTALDHEIGDTNLILTISGGAPGQRYEYQLKVSADGLSESSFKDELRNIEPQTSQGDVGRQMAAEVFRAAMEERVLELPRVAEAIEPDSLVMTLSVQSGDVAKLVQRAVFEEDSAAAPSLGPDAVELEVRKGLSVSRAATPTGLSNVLTKLAAIQEKIGQP
jgi:hypothetical protein